MTQLTQNTEGQLAMAESHPSEVRVVVHSRANAVDLDTMPTRRLYPGTPPRPDGERFAKHAFSDAGPFGRRG